MAWMNKRHLKLFDEPIVEFFSANLINAVSCQNAFMTDNIDDTWDYVINCAAETRPGQSDAVYQEGVLRITQNCANEAAKIQVKRYIELSTASMNSSEKISQKEDCPLEPWTFVGKYKAKAEQEVSNVPNLNWTIIRLPIVYGIGDRRGLTPRIIIAALYKYLNETMKLLWNADMKMNVVHVEDVCTAILELMQNGKANKQIVNVVDDSRATQGLITDLLANIFDIKTDYWGIAMSNMTKVDMSGTIEEINDKHVVPWAEICQRDQIFNTPLTPYLEEELLLHKHLSVDNTKLKELGYQLRHPVVTRELLEAIVDDFIECNQFPKSLRN
jgi:nucleoside-diphosphate-sugar epimerase